MRRVLVAALGAAVVYGAGLAAQQPAAPQQIRTPKQMPFPQKPDWSKLEVETLHVRGKVYVIAGAGGNIAVQVGDDGVLLVDTGYEQMSAKVLTALRKLSNKTLRTIINTTIEGGKAIITTNAQADSRFENKDSIMVQKLRSERGREQP